MEADLQHHIARLRIALATLIGLLFGVAFLVLNSLPAHASGSISCGQAECYVSSTVSSESNWWTSDYVASDGSTATGGSRNGATPTFITSYKPCDYWLPSGGGSSVDRYPAENSNRMNCHFSDGAVSNGGGGFIRYACSPTGDRAANGRVNYFVQQVQPDGTKKWVFARYRCVFPTDAYAPIERMDQRGKVYTGAEASFFYSSTAPSVASNTTYNSGGRLSNTTGYVNRGVDLNNPGAYIGAWQPAFTAQTITNSGQPLYGYYRLDWTLDYRICERWSFPSWLGVPSRYDCSQRGQDVSATPYTYACNFNPPLTAGVRTDALFVPSQCSPQWVCEFTDPTTVAGHTVPITVMRNGENLAVSFPTPSVNGSGVANARSWQFYNAPQRQATPDLRYVKASWDWNAWRSYSKTGTIAFNWASESEAEAFVWDIRYRFTADFWLPVQDTVGGGFRYQWVSGSAECPQTHTSPSVAVVRATNR